VGNVKVLMIGVTSPEYVKRRALEIARGGKRKPGEPKVWVSSLLSVAKVLSQKNMLLLEMIQAFQPQSMPELAKISGRTKGNLSRSLHRMKRLGLVDLKGQLDGMTKRPIVIHDRVRVEWALNLKKTA
jgi:predicted transcriptional regulator